MKTSIFKSTISVLLVLLLCFSVLAPAVSAATDADSAALGDGAELPEVVLHAVAGDTPSATVTEADVKKVFTDLALGEGDYYGIRQKSSTDSPEKLSGTSNTASVNAGEYTVYRTAATVAGLSKTPDWEAGVSQDIAVRLYFTASFAVSGCDDGALFLDGRAVSGSVELYTDTEYTVSSKQVDAFTCMVEGAADGEPFTPSSDITVTAKYTPTECASYAVYKNGEGTVRLLVNGEEVGGYIPVGASFEVDAQPNTDRGYKPGNVVVTKGEQVLEGPQYGPAEDGDIFEVRATFVFAPETVNYEVNAASPKLKSSDFNKMFNESGSRSYGYARVDAPNSISAINLNNGTSFAAGEYYIYSAPYSRNNPDWSVAKIKRMILRTYYTAKFAVSGNADGEVYVNNIAVEDNTAKLYTDTEYTVTAKAVDEYFYVMSGAEDGAAFTPSSKLNVKVVYYKTAHAEFTLAVNGLGTASVSSEGTVTDKYINEGSTFAVTATPNTNRGYKTDSIVVTKNGEEVEAAEGEYGPVADGESYAITVNFKFEPNEVNYDLHADSKLTSTNVAGLFGDSALSLLSKSYGYANLDSPEQINKLNTSGTKLEAGEYYIFKADGASNPKWSSARALKLKLRTYYNGSFTVVGSSDGEVYLNEKAVSGKLKLYADSEYTVTVSEVEGYEYSITGVAEGVSFTPSENITVTVTYAKPAYATFTMNVGEGGTATVRSGEFTVTEHINEGSTFTVEPHPNTDRGYKTDSITVTKNGEAVEAVDGEYGPVADGESYEITVSFKFEPQEVNYNLHAESKLTSTIICGLFGDNVLNLLVRSYGFASVETPDKITTASTGGSAVAPGEYYIYRSGNSSDWSDAKVLKLNLRTYYNGSFSVSGHDEGEVYLNSKATEGSVKLFTDEKYTVSVKQIEGFICTLYGAEDGVEFTPSEDVEVTAIYVKDAYADVAVTAGEGGSVRLMCDGNEMIDKIPEGSSFTVEANADSGRGYYPESVVVTKNGEELEAVDGKYGPVAEGESYEVTVTFAKATLTLSDGEVSLTDIYFRDYEAIEEAILGCAVLVPEKFADSARVKIEYVGYTLLGFDVYTSLSEPGDSAHAFGTSERGGTLKGGNTEKVRVTVTLPEYDIELRATATMTVSEDRVETAVESSAASFTVTYGDDLKAAVFDALRVYSIGDEQPVEFTPDDIALTPNALNANLRSAFTPQEVTVRYNGSDIYAASETAVSVYVRRAQSTLDAEDEIVTYGELPEAKVVTTPENLDHLKVIAGIDGGAEGFISIVIPDSVKERMQIKVAGIVVVDIYQMLTSYIGKDGASAADLKKLVGELHELLESNELVRQVVENSGFNVEVLDRVMSFISSLPDLGTDLRIRLDQVPENAGTYTMFAISTDTNYTTSESLSTIIIRPKRTTEDETVELRFREEMQGDGAVKTLSYTEAQSFGFGGDLYINDTLTEADGLRTLYVGTTLRGDVISQSEPVREPGVYTETVFMTGGNYIVSPLIREYTINRGDTKLMMDDLTVTYDGKAHALEAYLEDGSELDGVSVVYVGTGYLSSRAPVNAGEYTVIATYAGDKAQKPDSVTAKLTIEKRDAVITLNCVEELTYGEIDRDSTSKAKVGYTVSGTVEGDDLGYIIPVLDLGSNFPNVGEYNVHARFIQRNNNYNVTVENATFRIVPKPVTVTIDSAEKNIGEKDPAFTYTVTDAQGKAVETKLNLKLAREEGEEAGEYRIYVSEFKETNYVIDAEKSSDGVLTIKGNKLLLGDANGDGVVDVTDATCVQMYAAGLRELTAEQLEAADVNGDGTVDVTDATQIQKYCAGLIDGFEKA